LVQPVSPRPDVAGSYPQPLDAFAAVPGFYFGKGKLLTVCDQEKFGRVAFAHSELNGHQHWLAAVGDQGRQALAGFWT
jgi:hypothetical protein